MESNQYDAENRVFPTRLRDLCPASDRHSQVELANILGVSRQTVNNWTLGKSEPKYETLVKIAQHFNVTVDWLLGMPNASKEINADKHQVMITTGLCEEAVDELLYVTSRYQPAIEYLLSMNCFSNAMRDLHHALGISNNFSMHDDRFELTLVKNNNALKEDDFQRDQAFLPYKGIRPSELVIYFVTHCFDRLKAHAESDIRQTNWDRTRRFLQNGNDNGTEE